MEHSSSRFDRIAGNYATSEVHTQSPTLQRLLEWTNPVAGLEVCDVACGAGGTGLFLASSGARVTFVDAAPSMLAIVEQLAGQRGLPAKVLQSYAEAIPLPSSHFDLVLSRLAAHHFTDVRKAVSEMARLARPGGRVAVIDLEGSTDSVNDEFNHRLERLHDPTHVRSYTASQWRDFFEAAGLAVEHLAPRQSEKVGGVSLRRWCEIANSGEEAEQALRQLLSEAPTEIREALGITRADGEFMMPVRTVLIVGRKVGV